MPRHYAFVSFGENGFQLHTRGSGGMHEAVAYCSNHSWTFIAGAFLGGEEDPADGLRKSLLLSLRSLYDRAPAGALRRVAFEAGWTDRTISSVLQDFILEHGLEGMFLAYAKKRAAAGAEE